MPKIPTAADAGLGNRTFRPGAINETAIPRAAFGTGIAQSLQHVAGIAERGERQDAQDQALLARQHQAILSERERVADAASKARANQAMLRAEDELAQDEQDHAEAIVSGRLERGTEIQAWQDRAKERIASAVENVPDEHRATVQQALEHRARVGARGLDRALTKRDRGDSLAGLEATLEATQRQHLTDPGGAEQRAVTAIQQLGPAAGMTAADAQRRLQLWRETTSVTSAGTLISRARDDNAALDQVGAKLDTPEFANLDPNRKLALQNQIAGIKAANIQRADTERRRAEAEAEKRERTAEREYNAAADLITAGKRLSPGFVERITTATAGTPYSAQLSELLADTPVQSAFAQLPLSQQRLELDAARERLQAAGTDPAAEKRLAKLERAHDAAERDYKAEPLRAAAERGLIDVEPIRMDSLPALVESIGSRMQGAAVVAAQTGKTVSPLLSEEAEKLGGMLRMLPVQQRGAALSQLGAVLGPGVSAAMAAQVAPKDKALGVALSMAGEATSEGRATAEIVLRGDQFLADKGAKGAEVDDVRANLSKELGDTIPQAARQQMLEAAVLVHFGKQSTGDSISAAGAVALAVGGSMMEHAGDRIPVPAGVDLEKALQAVTPESLASQTPGGSVRAGGLELPVDVFVRSLPATRLMPVGKGRYVPIVSGRPVVNARGEPVVVGVR